MDTRPKDERDLFEVFGAPDDGETNAEAAPASESQSESAKPKPIRGGISLAGLAGGAASLVWASAMAAGIVDHYGGADALLALPLPVQGALIGWVAAPALLFWIASAAAANAVKARRIAARLAAPPSLEAQTQRADLLNESIAAAAARMAELESMLERNTEAFDSIVEASRESAEAGVQALQQEREALIALNSDFRQQTDAIAQSIGRQIRLLREASKLAQSEIASAERALEQQFASFDSVAAVVSERTEAIRAATEQAAAVAESLNGAMGGMLEGLAEATRLADAARESSQHAVVAANDTASALREATYGAVVEAKRAAQFIRAEAASLKRTPAETLSALHESANIASEESYAASEKHAAAAIKRARAFSTPPAEAPTPLRDARSWTAAPKSAPAPANEDASDLVSFAPSADADANLKRAALSIVASAGVILDRVLSAQDLDRIARASREGRTARRRAVADAAPGAVGRITRQLKRSAASHAIATRFRARPDLAKSEVKGEWSDLVRAYLLLDAALG